jgi:hypothetical protein
VVVHAWSTFDILERVGRSGYSVSDTHGTMGCMATLSVKSKPGHWSSSGLSSFTRGNVDAHNLLRSQVLAEVTCLAAEPPDGVCNSYNQL